MVRSILWKDLDELAKRITGPWILGGSTQFRTPLKKKIDQLVLMELVAHLKIGSFEAIFVILSSKVPILLEVVVLSSRG